MAADPQHLEQAISGEGGPTSFPIGLESMLLAEMQAAQAQRQQHPLTAKHFLSSYNPYNLHVSPLLGTSKSHPDQPQSGQSPSISILGMSLPDMTCTSSPSNSPLGQGSGFLTESILPPHHMEGTSHMEWASHHTLSAQCSGACPMQRTTSALLAVVALEEQEAGNEEEAAAALTALAEDLGGMSGEGRGRHGTKRYSRSPFRPASPGPAIKRHSQADCKLCPSSQ
jgi:hypothetical protein